MRLLVLIDPGRQGTGLSETADGLAERAVGDEVRVPICSDQVGSG